MTKYKPIFDNFTSEHGGVKVINVCLAITDLLVIFAVVFLYFCQETVEVNRMRFASLLDWCHAGLTLFVSGCKSALLRTTMLCIALSLCMRVFNILKYRFFFK